MRIFGWFLVLVGLLGVCLALVVAIDAGCGVDREEGTRALKAAGFTDVVIGNYAWWRCSKGDAYASHFVATNPVGKRVSGYICCGSWGKGCTVRF